MNSRLSGGWLDAVPDQIAEGVGIPISGGPMEHKTYWPITEEERQIRLYDYESERAAIGSALMSPEAAQIVVTGLDAADFASPLNRTIFESVRHLHEHGAVDALLLRAELERIGKLDYIGGVQGLVEIAESVATSANAEYYVRMVRELGSKRRLRAELLDLADKCANGSELPEIVRRIESLTAEPQTDEGWIGKLGTPVPWELLPKAPEIPWIVESLIARGAVTQFVGLWKAGKTTYLAAMLHHLSKGGMFGGLEIAKSKALVITEEAAWVWRRRCDEFGGGDNINFWCRPFAGRASWEQWDSFIRDLSLYVTREAYDLVVFDSMPNLWPVEKENDAGEMARATVPMQRIAVAGAGVLLVHHPRKGDGNQGQSGRGSGAFAATVDIIVELRRFEPDNLEDKRRVISVMGRFGTDERVVEWRGGAHFAYIGDKEGAKANEMLEAIVKTLEYEGRPMSAKEIVENWPDDEPPSKRTVERALRAAVKDGELVQVSERTRGRNAQSALYDLPPSSEPFFDPFAFEDEPTQQELFDE